MPGTECFLSTLLILTLPGFVEPLAVSRSLRQAKGQANSAKIFVSLEQATRWECTLPAKLNFDEGRVQEFKNRNELLDAVASPRRKSRPFLWLRYGDGDFQSMSGMVAGSSEGADMNGQCVRDGLAQAFLGTGSNAVSSETQPDVIEAVGAFYLCNQTHPELYEKTERFLESHPVHKYVYSDDFYFPVGNPRSSPEDSWVVAARKSKRPVVIVGPKHLESLHCMLEHKAFFEIPIPFDKDCKDVERLVPQLVQFSKTRFPEESVLFVVAGSAIGKMIAYKAFQSLRHKDMFIDVGASIDGFAGRESRSYNQGVARGLCFLSKGWMAYDLCKRECETAIRTLNEEVPCRECHTGEVYHKWH